ncbi:EAL domain-containing response regulator [Vibrio tasmaniensis]|uniref:EAL domain-containing response regulator n=1 Tax=Vibrio tasmaniensis TaxID=212663 RepID=UPI00107EEE5B|nr:EAL domain-containing protein [Vibrio tasmaniensis]
MKKNLLVIDDDLFHLEIFEKILGNPEEFTVLKAQSGEDALEILTYNVVEIVFCDLAMPEQDGFEFIRKFSEKYNSVPVAFLSSVRHDVMTTAVHFAKMLGVNNVRSISKPFNKDDLLSHVLWAKSLALSSSLKKAVLLPSLSEQDIIKEIHSDNTEILYEPIYNTSTLEVVGLDVKLTVVTERNERVSHEKVMTVIDQDDLSTVYIEIVFEKVLPHLKAWLETNSGIHLNIQIPHKGMFDRNFAYSIIARLNEFSIPSHAINIEITEMNYIDNQSLLLENASRLVIDGLSLSLGDYGVGHSTMKDLIIGPFSELKIDASLVDSFLTDDKTRLVVSSLVSLSNNLEIRSAAKGIETYSQFIALKKLGCEFLQGGFLSKPLSLLQVDQVLMKPNDNVSFESGLE